MNICYICNTNVIFEGNTTETNKIGIKRDDKIICTGCDEMSDLFSDNKPKIIKNEKKTTDTKKLTKCMKCKKNYERNICKKCNITNVLYLRKNKKKKK